MRPAELLPHRLHFELSTKEVLCVFFRERGQPGIGMDVFGAFDLEG